MGRSRWGHTADRPTWPTGDTRGNGGPPRAGTRSGRPHTARRAQLHRRARAGPPPFSPRLLRAGRHQRPRGGGRSRSGAAPRSRPRPPGPRRFEAGSALRSRSEPPAPAMVQPEEQARLYRPRPELLPAAHVPSLPHYRRLYRRSVEEPQGEGRAGRALPELGALPGVAEPSPSVPAAPAGIRSGFRFSVRWVVSCARCFCRVLG